MTAIKFIILQVNFYMLLSISQTVLYFLVFPLDPIQLDNLVGNYGFSKNLV